MKKLIKSILVFLIKKSYNNCLTLKIMNSIYENSNWRYKDFIIRNIKFPNKDFKWKIKLLNGKYVKTKVLKDKTISWQFAFSYKWHDLGLTKIEQILNDYYDVKYHYIDIGANLGLRALYSLSSGRNSILFEPNTELNSFTEDLCKQNNFSNYKIEPLCISSTKGKQKFYISESSYMSSLNKTNAEPDKIIKEIDVNLITLDEYINTNNEIIPKIIKIDVEGHEFDVLKGSLATLKKYSPTVIVEILDISDNRSQIFNFFRTLNYSAFAILNNDEMFLRRIDFGVNNFNYRTTNYVFVKEEILLNKLQSYSIF